MHKQRRIRLPHQLTRPESWQAAKPQRVLRLWASEHVHPHLAQALAVQLCELPAPRQPVAVAEGGCQVLYVSIEGQLEVREHWQLSDGPQECLTPIVEKVVATGNLRTMQHC